MGKPYTYISDQQMYVKTGEEWNAIKDAQQVKRTEGVTNGTALEPLSVGDTRVLHWNGYGQPTTIGRVDSTYEQDDYFGKRTMVQFAVIACKNNSRYIGGIERFTYQPE